MAWIRTHLNNGNGSLVVMAIAAAGFLIILGQVWGDVLDNKAMAAELKKKLNQTATDVEVEKEKVRRLTKQQEQYSGDMSLNATFQAVQVIKMDNLEKSVEELKRLLKKLTEKERGP